MKKVAFITTLGSRDIQLDEKLDYKSDENFADELFEDRNFKSLIIKNPRKQGKYILNNFDNYEDFIKYPIIKPAILHILNGVSKIDKFFIVYTDQKNSEEKYKQRDTLYFAEILEKILKRDFADKILNIQRIKITGNLTFYDEMYDYISDIAKKRFNFNVNAYKVYLLAQGGIDAINTALLLKTIEFFPNLVHLHKPENKNDVSILSFPDKFRLNSNKNFVINAVINYNYSLVIENFPNINENVTKLCEYAHHRLRLNYQGAFSICEKILTNTNENEYFVKHRLQEGVKLLNENLILNKQKDLYLSAKIKYKQHYYGDFLMKIFTLSENILKPYILKLGFDITYNENDGHKRWNKKFNEKDKEENGKLSQALRNNKLKGPNGLKYDTPNKYAFIGILDYFSERDSTLKNIVNLGKIIFTLADLRNTVAHKLDTVTKEMIEDELKNKHKISLRDFIEKLDNYYNLNSIDDFGIYDEINNKVISLLE